MTDDSDEERPTGYKSPPVEHQFVPGRSGNPNGRKPKAVRALMPRQSRRDIIAVGETPTRIRINGSTKLLSAIEAVLIRLLQKALSGHVQSMALFIRLYNGAVQDHSEEFKAVFAFVEMVEIDMIKKPVPKENEVFAARLLNSLREKTRRI